jgi:hypothetical protein
VLLLTQVVGKVRLALEPMVNHWWQVPLYVSAVDVRLSAEELRQLDRVSDPAAADYPYGAPGIEQRDRVLAQSRRLPTGV